MATPMTSPPPLKHFDIATITLNNEIGRGQCRVYEGVKDGQEIAVKVMNCDKGKVPEEVELQNSLSSHPNILPLLGVSHSQNMFQVYILMERADMSLHQYLYREKRKPSPQLSLNWALQIARGLHHIHQHGLAHRDLKSANVLLFENQDILKICDFGSAKTLKVTATKTGEAGTFRWMAPEFIEKSVEKINKRCDMFSYGMILYEIFTHEVPFADLKSEIDVALFIRDKKRPSIPSKLPKYLKTLMAQCWEHSAYDRPTSSDILMVLDKGAQFLQATESSDVERVKQMVAEFVNVNTRNEKEETALHIASRRGDLTIVGVLIGAKAGIDLQDKDGNTPLLWASWKGHSKVVEVLLKEKADTTICDEDGFSPLYVASQCEHTKIVEMLLLKGADPNLTAKVMGSSPLGIASEKGHVQTANKLLDLGAHINHQNKNGCTPLYTASGKGHLPVVELLLKERADITICDKNGTSPLYIASQEGHTQTVELLLREGADPNLTDTNGASPLFIASQKGHTQTVELLLREGADPNLTRTTGLVSPLVMAAQEGHTEVVEKLLRAGANANHQTKSGNTALSMATVKDHHEIVTLLKKYLH